MIRLFSMNIWSGLTYHGLAKMKEFETPALREFRFSALRQELERLRPDVIFLNEANPMPGYGERLAALLGYDLHWHMGVSGLRAGNLGLPVNLREGDVILAGKQFRTHFSGRVQLAGDGFCGNRFSAHFGDMTQAVLCSAVLPGTNQSFYLCCTHFTASPAIDETTFRLLSPLAEQWGFSPKEVEKTKQKMRALKQRKIREAKALAEWLRKTVPPEAPLIVGGDLNAEAEWEELQILTQAGFRRAEMEPSPCKTWDVRCNTNLQEYYIPLTRQRQPTLYAQLDALEEMTPRDIDHFYTKNISPDQIRACRLCGQNKAEGRHASDHFGLLLELEL